MDRAVIALDLGGTKLAGALFSDAGTLLHRQVNPLPAQRGEAVGDLIVQTIAEIQKIFSSQYFIHSIGICVPGIYRSRTKCVWAPNIPGWENYPLWEKLQEVSKGAQVYIDSDRACCILGEVWQGAARQCRDAIFMTVGTGIGAGILVGGEVLRGAHDIAGAIGWMALDRPYKEAYEQCGCFEQYASGEGIAKTIKDIVRANPHAGGLADLPVEQLKARRVFEAYAQQDPLALEAMALVLQYWGMATANLVSLFNPEKIIFGGGVFGPAAVFLPQIRKEAEKWAQPISMKNVELAISALDGSASLYGAAYLALKAKNKTAYGTDI